VDIQESSVQRTQGRRPPPRTSGENGRRVSVLVRTLAAAVVLLAGCVVEPEREAQDLLPYLLMPTSTSVTIRWRTSVETEGAVRYGRTANLGMMEVFHPGPVQWHSFTLEDLLPDTDYFYEALADGEVVGETYAFRTAPEEAVPFVFAVVGDTMYSGQEKLQIKDRILGDAPSFLIHLGDFAAETGGYEERLWRRHFFEDYEDLLSRVPLIPVVGNHEYQGVIVVFFSIPGAAPLFHDYFSTAEQERWFSFDWGNVHFIVLDANIAEDLQPDSEQIRWLEQDLVKSTDGEDDPDWRVACWHEPAFSSGAGQIDFPGQPLRENVAPLMERYGVDVVFYGHDHFYERSVKDGVTYVLSGGGGAAPHPIFPDINPYSQKVMETYQYMRVLVNGRFLRVEAVDPLGTVLDTFSLEKEPAPPRPGPDEEPDDPQGGCGCSVVERPGLLEVPLGFVVVLAVAFTLRMRRRHRPGKRDA